MLTQERELALGMLPVGVTAGDVCKTTELQHSHSMIYHCETAATPRSDWNVRTSWIWSAQGDDPS